MLTFGILGRTGVLGENLRSRHGIAVAMFLAASLLITTGVLAITFDTIVNYLVTNVLPIEPANPAYGGDFWEHPDPRHFGIYFQLLRPYAWLMPSLIAIGSAFFVIAVAIEHCS
jgi:hypothetical protein